MQWSSIKTLFILCFLVLDVYLLYQFIDKQKESDYDVFEQQESSIEDQLKLEDIVITEDLPEEEVEQSYISVKQKVFEEKDMRLFAKHQNQIPAFISNKMIVSAFKDPIPIEDSDSIEEDVKSNIIYPDNYDFWDWNKDLNVLIFFQVKNGQPVFFNQSGLLLVFLNDDNEMTFYTQTMLGNDSDDYNESKKTLIKPLRAIYTIYNRNELFHGENVTDAGLGYYTALPVTGDLQIFAPTWKITVNDERDYFVNAIEGVVYSSDAIKFLGETLTAIKENVSVLENEDLKELVLNGLSQRLNSFNRSEIQ